MKATELHTAVKVTRVDLLCPRCTVGDAQVVMKATGQSRLSQPPTMQHVCPWCDYSEFTKDLYPRMDTAPDVDVSSGLVRLISLYLGIVAIILALVAIFK